MQSKHSETSFLIGWTCPTYPAVPLSMSAMSAARHILFTCRRASTERDEDQRSVIDGRTEVVKRVEHKVERLEPVDVELGVLHSVNIVQRQRAQDLL